MKGVCGAAALHLFDSNSQYLLPKNPVSTNRRNVTDDNRHGALGRPPQNDREEMLARLDPEQIAATIGWDTFDKYANRRELRTRDVADFLGVSDWTVKSWRREGKHCHIAR